MTKSNKAYIALFGFVLLAAAGLRLYHLTFSSLWSDELATWFDTWQPTFHDFWHTYTQLEMTPPLFFLAEFATSRALEATEFAIRLPALVFGMGFVMATGLFAYELAGKHRAAGIIGVALAATSYRAIYFSQEARAYSLMYFLAALSGSAWLRLKPQTARLRDSGAWLYALTAIALAYTHYYGVVMAMAQGLTALFIAPLTRQRTLYWLKLYLLISLAYLPWVYFLIHQPMPDASMIQNAPPFNEIFVAHRELFGSSAVNSLLALLLGVVAIFLTPRRRAAVAAMAWVFLPFIIVWLISQYHPIYAIRYYMVALAPALAASAVGAYELKRSGRELCVFATILFCALGLYETIIARQTYVSQKGPQVREVTAASFEFLQAHPKAAFVVIALPIFMENYYLERMHSPRGYDLCFASGPLARFDKNKPPLPFDICSKNGPFAQFTNWSSLASDAQTVVMTAYTESNADIDGLYKSGLPPGYHVVERRDFYQSTAAVLERDHL